MKTDQFLLGIDFGTDSVRSVMMTADGKEIASSVIGFSRWRDGLYCDPAKNLFRQHPLDYIEGMEQAVCSCLKQAGKPAAGLVKGIGIDTTGSTPVAVNEAGIPLSLLQGFETNPNAMFVLWKDHTAVLEARQINEHAKHFDIDYLQYVGGVYSSEWFWAKLLHILREDDAIRRNCYSWVEHCDWIPFLLTGAKHLSQMKRSRCAAGHKALWADEFYGLPPDNFFGTLDPLLKGFTQRLFTNTYTADQPAGTLGPEWAAKLGLTTDVVVAAGAFDAHMGAVGGQIIPYHLSKVMGTSTCDMLVAPMNEMNGNLVKGICGQVPGSVIPGMMGMEAGQSAFGDVYAWFSKLLQWPFQNLLAESNLIDPVKAGLIKKELDDKLIHSLSEAASQLPLDENSELALDWLNGRRTPYANQQLEAAITGLSLASNAPSVFKALAEATCFGAKKIIDCFNQQDVKIQGVIGLGGVARKSPFMMQLMSDVINMPLRIHRSEQSCATGAAMFAATASGIYPKVEEAMAAMGQGFDQQYYPDKQRGVFYNKKYKQYNSLGNFVEQHLTSHIS